MKLKITQAVLLSGILAISTAFQHRAGAADAANPVNEYALDKILTPKPGPKPRINGAKVFGARPGSPFLFQVPASGDKPLTFSATNLPAGLSLDSATGRITGSVATPGSHKVKITVTNKLGAATSTLRIEIGEALCLTPPMGWNSWYVFSESVSQEGVTRIADAMVQSRLAEHGWTYVNLDDCWQGPRGGKWNGLQGNERFPDMKKMCDHIHSLGLKAGIYSTPWMGSYAGFRGGSWSDEKADYESVALPAEQRLQPNQIYGRYPGSIKRNLSKVGSNWLCDADAHQWAEWGFDYVKHDWSPNDVPTTKRLAEGLRASGRDIVLSLSNTAPFKNAPELSKLAQAWRTTGDIHESWNSINAIGFDQEKWAPFTSPGHWNDPDMLQIGMIGRPNSPNTVFHRTQLAPDEQYTQISLWSLLGAPLIVSCDLTQMDPFTFNLLCNDEVIEVDQDPLGAAPKRIKAATNLATPNPDPKVKVKPIYDGPEIWSRPLEDGSLAVGLFNRTDKELPITLNMSDLSLTGPQRIRDLWRQKDIGAPAEKFEAAIPPHGVVLLRVSKP